jgi:hypothetical protein
MRSRPFVVLSSVLFAAVAVAHLLRLLNGWSVEFAGRQVPMFASWLGLAISGVLSGWGFSLSARGRA